MIIGYNYSGITYTVNGISDVYNMNCDTCDGHHCTVCSRKEIQMKIQPFCPYDLVDDMLKYESHYIKDCPKCGAEAEVRQIGRIGNYYVACTECNNDTIGFDTKEEAIKEWNKRK